MHKNSRGFSLMEIVIAIAIIGIFFAGITVVFTQVGKGVMVTRTRTVATNLAQERIEALKNISYSRLRATSALDFSTYGYDHTFYPPETGILVGDIPYRREVLVQRVVENASGQLEETAPDAGDTSLKKVTVTVRWTEEGRSNSFSLSNLREDPDRRPRDGTITGTVQDEDSAAYLSGVKVAVFDNLNWNAVTDAGGAYSIKVPTGTYQVKATKDGYWPRTSGSLNVGAAPVNCPLTLKQMALGAVTGYVFINDHPLISKVCASTTTALGENVEFVELYNPTTSHFAMNDAAFDMKYVDENNIISDVNLVYISSSIAPQSYYLVANTGTLVLGGYSLHADAKYAGSDLQNLIHTTKRGGVIISPAGAVSDKVGWGPGVGAAPSNAVEYSGITSLINEGCAHMRMTLGGYLASTYSNAYDTDNNTNNFFSNLNIGSFRAASSTAPARAPLSGSPAYGAIISCGDGVSLPTTAYMVNPTSSRLAFFSIPSVATGTWTVSAYYRGASFSAYREVSNVQVLTSGQTPGIPNAVTAPAWPVSGYNYLILTSTSSKGFAAGTVRSGGAGVGGIKVQSGTAYTYTSAGGTYILPLDPGTYSITANPANLNAGYISHTIEDVAVAEGQISSGNDFDIAPGGSIGGRVLSNAGDFLPDILVVACDFNGNEVSSVLTQPDGTFQVKNLPTSGNNFTVRPVLDSGETAAPSQRTVTVSAGSVRWTDTAGVYSSFTVTSAYGNITGHVTSNSQPINTGVLIIATTSTISADPADITDGLRSSGILYYGTVSHSDGTYTLPVRGGYLYNVYAWFSTMASGAVSMEPRKSAANKAVSAGGSTNADFSWP